MILVSACLLGVNCKYNGGNNYNENVINFLKDKQYVFMCPEQLGGLPTPRKPAEIVLANDEVGIKVLCKDGDDVTDNYKRGMQEVINFVKLHNVDYAILKSKSPSCGKGKIYDGTHKSILIEGDGVLVQALNQLGIKVYTENEISLIEQELL